MDKRVFFTISILLLFCSFTLVFASSLSELNYEKGESIFLKNLPWSQKDPFVHPSFEVKKEKGEPKGEDAAKLAPKTTECLPPPLDLSAILFSEDSKSAVINGQVVHVGSIIKNQKIIEINRNNVKVDFNGKVFKVGLNDLINLKDED